ncbi:urotensin-2 [Ornithorhynchus anatinus]|uniref:urotensin-2 n=1 Tax=Ornithorhynchus anatinus TaxID=9258 RepID=UPI00015A981A|nr:urotensin-2 [Ornithorhynchus anatinus]
MNKPIYCCLIFITFFCPLFSLPILDSSETSYQLSAVDEDANLNLKELDRASLLQALSELLDTQKDDGLRKTDLGSSIYNPIGSTKETLDGKDPATSLLSRLLTKTRKQSKKHVPSSNCFWKYCV